MRYCDSKNFCPHEMMKEMISSATVVAAPYAYFFVPFIRHSLLDWMGVRLDELIVIIDEAHNIPDYTREIESFELSRALLDMVQKEVDEYGDPEILQGVSIMDMVIEMRKLLQGGGGRVPDRGGRPDTSLVPGGGPDERLHGVIPGHRDRLPRP